MSLLTTSDYVLECPVHASEGCGVIIVPAIQNSAGGWLIVLGGAGEEVQQAVGIRACGLALGGRHGRLDLSVYALHLRALIVHARHELDDALLGDGAPAKTGRASIACIGPITAATARELGSNVQVEARSYTTEGLAAALIDYFSARR